MKEIEKNEELIDSQGEQLALPINDSDEYMYKSNNLTESNYMLTLNEQRLLLLGIKKLRPKYINANLKPSQLRTLAAREEFSTMKIYVNEFKETFNINSNNMYSVLKKTADLLFSRYIPYKKDDGTCVNKRWVITCGYNKAERFVELAFHPDLILDLLVFSSNRQYNKSKFNNFYELTGSYSFRIFELLNNYAYRGERTFELQDFRNKIGLENGKYKSFSELNRRVIKPTVEELNKKTDLDITFKAERKGRTVDSLIFTMKRKELPKEMEVESVIDIRPSDDIERTKELLGIEDLSINEANRVIDSAIRGIKDNHIDVAFQDYLLEKVSELDKYKEENYIKDYISLLCTFLLKNSFYDKKRRVGEPKNTEEKTSKTKPKPKVENSTKKKKVNKEPTPEEVAVKELVNIDDLSKGEINRIIASTVAGIQALDKELTFREYLSSKLEEVDKYKKENDIDDYISLLCSFLKKNSCYDKKRSFKKSNKKKETSKKNMSGFNNFDGRSYDYSELERKLLGRD